MTATFNEPKYQIDVPDFRCSRCAAEVACETAYFSAVFFAEEAFHRRSYCTSCWNEESARARTQSGAETPLPVVPGAYAFWRSRRPSLPEASPGRLRFDSALVLDFFRRIGAETPGPAAGAAAPAGGDGPRAAGAGEREELQFFLALLLLRKKLLKYVSCQERSGCEWLKLSEKAAPAPSGESSPEAIRYHWVRNPGLSDAQLERVKVRLGELLAMQL